MKCKWEIPLRIILLIYLSVSLSSYATGQVTIEIDESSNGQINILTREGEEWVEDEELDHHSAPSMVLFKGHFWLVFAAMKCHGLNWPDAYDCGDKSSELIILKSREPCYPDDSDCNIKDWEHIITIPLPDEPTNGIWHLVEPILTVTPDDRLMLNYIRRETVLLPDRSWKPNSYQPTVRFSDDGRHWSEPVDILKDRFLWLTDVVWWEGIAWGLAFGWYEPSDPMSAVRLCSCSDHGLYGPNWMTWEVRPDPLIPESWQNTTEASMVFTEDGKAVTAIRDELYQTMHCRHSLRIGTTTANSGDLGHFEFSLHQSTRGDMPRLINIPEVGVVLGARGSPDFSTDLYLVDPETRSLTFLDKIEPPLEDRNRGIEDKWIKTCLIEDEWIEGNCVEENPIEGYLVEDKWIEGKCVKENWEDGAYADFVWHNNHLYIVYYAGSSRESWIYTVKATFAQADAQENDLDIIRISQCEGKVTHVGVHIEDSFRVEAMLEITYDDKTKTKDTPSWIEFCKMGDDDACKGVLNLLLTAKTSGQRVVILEETNAPCIGKVDDVNDVPAPCQYMLDELPEPWKNQVYWIGICPDSTDQGNGAVDDVNDVRAPCQYMLDELPEPWKNQVYWIGLYPDYLVDQWLMSSD